MARSVPQNTDPVDRLLGALPPDLEIACVRDGPATVVAAGASDLRSARGTDALRALDELRSGWWAGFFAYDLGRSVEHVPQIAPVDEALPDLLLARFDARVIIGPGGDARLLGDGPARRALEHALGAADVPPPHPPRLGPWTSSLDRPDFEEAVRRVLQHIGAGDCFQVNLTRRLACDGAPDPATLYRVLSRGNPAPHAALVRIGEVGVVSASPERFLRRDGRLVETRPIKGTDADPDRLRSSTKDRAENVMIVDLARNDLGRVCEFGSVHVPDLCRLEAHPGLYHLVSTVRGRLRPTVGLGGLVRATFPPASITGAPKPRVMEIIESLEPVRRGAYCGAVGFVDTDRGTCDLNVAIRTFTVVGGRTTFGVGGGVVADSRPSSEWEETELKASRLLSLVSGGAAQTSR